MTANKDSAPRLAPGDTVTLTGTRKRFLVTEGPNRKGEFLVSLGKVQMWVHESRLKRQSTQKKKKPLRKRTSAPLPAGSGSARIDLHAMTAQEAVIALEQVLDRALLENSEHIEVVHGIGEGILKNAVHRYLEGSSHVARFELDNTNPGVTLVYL